MREESSLLSTFVGTVRQVDIGALSPVARKVFNYAFPVFNETPVLSPSSRAALARGDKVEKPFNYRRLAGGPDLQRRSYFTLCSDESGDDDFTLLLELTYYADPRRSGELHVFEGSHPIFTDKGTGELGVFPGYRPAPNSLVVAFMSRPNAPHPLLVPEANPLGDRAAGKAFRESAPQSDRGVILLELPTHVRFVRHDGVFDLRRPANQELLNNWVREKLFNTVYLYPKPFAGPPPINIKEVIKSHHRVTNYWPHTDEHPKLAANAFNSLALFADETDDGTFGSLLRFLLFHGRGGSPVTEAIGATLRWRGGVRALIYPSARNDITCHWQGHELIKQQGWCLVDYSASLPPPPNYRLIIDPKFWFADPLEFNPAPADSPNAGSWQVLGVRERWKRNHLARVEEWYKTERDKVMRRLTKRWWQLWIN